MRKRRVRVPIEDKEKIEARLAAGESLRSVARSYDICFQSLQYWRRQWGLPALKICRTKGEDHPNWKGGVSIDKWGYRLLYAPQRKKSHPYTYEHVLVAEEKIGRRLHKNEHVHHLNGQKLDNRPENLLVCTASEHRILHRQLEELAIQMVLDGRIVYRDQKYQWA